MTYAIRARISAWSMPVIAVLLLAYIKYVLLGSAALRIALQHTGDWPMPGEQLVPDARNVASFLASVKTRDGGAYATLLWIDAGLVFLLLAAFASIAWFAWLRLPARRLPVALAVSALLFASSDWSENALLYLAMTAGDPAASPHLGWATLATTLKWILLGASAGLAALALGAVAVRPLYDAFFSDLPPLMDSAWRRLDFLVNRERRYEPQDGSLKLRRPAFWLYALTVVFVCYGPTWDGLCSMAPRAMPWVLAAAGLALAGVSVWAWATRLRPAVQERIGKHFRPLEGTVEPALLSRRRLISFAVMHLFGALPVLPAMAAVGALFLIRSGCGEYQDQDPDLARIISFTSFARFAVCSLAVAAFWALWRETRSTAALVYSQAGLVVAAALGIWMLAPANATEASGAPYLHLFLLAAPIACLALCLAPWIARWSLRHEQAPSDEERARLRRLLPQNELFVPRPVDPPLNWVRAWHGVLGSLAERIPQIVMPASLFVVLAPADWLSSALTAGIVLGVCLSTWGNMSARWQHMVRDVSRWLLGGTAIVVSAAVVVLAVLRLAKVSYVTTLLDATPFGTIFGLVTMAYVLSWLVEYWMNRAIAEELLGLFKDDSSSVADSRGVLAYDYGGAKDVGVEPKARKLMVHGIGRFLVVGRLSRRTDEPAFHSYELLELFRKLMSERDRGYGKIARQTQLYFSLLNIAVVLIGAGFGLSYWYLSRQLPPDAVVTVQPRAAPEKLASLAQRLVAPPGDSRPAVVVAASGGGTRAALYAAHVLEGLHNLGASRDIVLTSGVSGGGAALAYFAANYRRLVDAPATAEWKAFKDRVSEPFIEDVLEGATELRIFGTAPLSSLLAESFERRLLKGAAQATFELPPGTPALILNTTITGHPAEDSRLLESVLDAPGNSCEEAQRPYRLLHGGRLIFTNLANVAAFQDEERIADVRLPYEVVRDPSIRLAYAAALNANFPPVFPNARVAMPGLRGAEGCPDRSYFVTDGGAQENLGLVSALLAVHSALEEIAAACGSRSRPAYCEGKLRPLHFVLAEASAASYDYNQDRGISAGVDGGKERMTSGVTQLLIGRLEAAYRRTGMAAGTKDDVRFHPISLPLVFRARGGFGTHWMHAALIELNDPRFREWPLIAPPSATVTVEKEDLRKIWFALHRHDLPYCENRGYGDRRTDRVRLWICGGGSLPRDPHIQAWLALVEALRPAAPADPARRL